MATCDFDVHVHIHDGFGTVLGDLNDQDLGLSVGVPLDADDDQLRRITTSSPFVGGDFEIIATPAAGRLDVLLIVQGDDWAELNTRYRTAREWWRQAGSFWVDVVLEGDSLRYVARRPDVAGAPIDNGSFTALDRSYVLSFPIQPDPVVI